MSHDRYYKNWFRSRLAKILAAALLAGLAATLAMGKVLNKHEVDRRDLHQVARRTDTMKTICVGRFLIDIPEEAHIEFSGAKVDGFDISGFDETEAEFRSLRPTQPVASTRVDASAASG